GGARTDGQLLECFLSQRDQSAFETLVQRHGPMVLGVCRRVLHHEQDAEDACQATFLVLARKAAGIRKKNVLGGWLHGVAIHVATTLRRSILRRRGRELQGREVASAAGRDEVSWREV